MVVAPVFPYVAVLTSKLAGLGSGTPLVTTWHEVGGSLGRLAQCGKLIERATARVPQYPVAVSGITADRLAGIGPDRDAIEVVPNGIDVEDVRNAPLPGESGRERTSTRPRSAYGHRTRGVVDRSESFGAGSREGGRDDWSTDTVSMVFSLIRRTRT